MGPLQLLELLLKRKEMGRMTMWLLLLLQQQIRACRAGAQAVTLAVAVYLRPCFVDIQVCSSLPSDVFAAAVTVAPAVTAFLD